MKPKDELDARMAPMYEPTSTVTYSLEVIEELTGMSSAMILHYRESGLIEPATDSPTDNPQFDDQALHALRRIDYLRSTCGVNESGLKLMMELMAEVDRLRTELRQQR